MRIISVDPEKNEMDELANISLKNKLGSDLALLEGLKAIIVKEGLGRAPLQIDNVEKVIAEAVEKTGISAQTLTEAARTLAHGVSPVILFGKGISAQRDPQLVQALLGLATLVGAVDGERVGLLSLKGEANSQAAAQLQLESQFTLNGHKAVFAAIGDDYVSKKLVERVSKAPYLVVQAAYESELTEKADVVLPVTIWSEQEGHYVNLDGRVQKTAKAIEAPAGVRENKAVLVELAEQLSVSLSSDWQTAAHARKSSVVLN